MNINIHVSNKITAIEKPPTGAFLYINVVMHLTVNAECKTTASIAVVLFLATYQL